MICVALCRVNLPFSIHGAFAQQTIIGAALAIRLADAADEIRSVAATGLCVVRAALLLGALVMSHSQLSRMVADRYLLGCSRLSIVRMSDGKGRE